MAKPKVSLLEKAIVKEVPAPGATAAHAAKPSGRPWYAEILDKYPGDPEQRAYVVDQIGAAKEWGGDNHLLRVPMDLFLMMLEERRAK